MRKRNHLPSKLSFLAGFGWVSPLNSIINDTTGEWVSERERMERKTRGSEFATASGELTVSSLNFFHQQQLKLERTSWKLSKAWSFHVCFWKLYFGFSYTVTQHPTTIQSSRRTFPIKISRIISMFPLINFARTCSWVYRASATWVSRVTCFVSTWG